MSTIIGRAMVAGGGTNKVPQIFGDGSDGAVIINSNTTWNAETEDTGMIVKNFETLTIPNGVTVSAGNRNCGMIIRVQSDCFIAGTLVNRLSCKTLLSSDNVDFSSWPLTMLSGKGGDGGNGGSGRYAPTVTVGGSGMTGRFYGGGWSGGGAGGSGTTAVKLHGGSVDTLTTAVTTALFAGGTAMLTANTTELGNGINGGGGAGYTASNGNGGNGGTGAGTAGSAPTGFDSCGGGGAGNYGGGVIILLVGGKLTFSGTIDCSGGPGGEGGAAGSASSSYGGNGGGGAGGGRIFICHQGSINNTGTLNVSGGAAGAGGKEVAFSTKGNPGTAGTNGTTVIKTYDQYKKEDVA